MFRNSPSSLGVKKFFDKYVELAPERLDAYFPGQWKLTERLEDFGSRIYREEINDDANLLLFLIDVAVWKQPYEQQAKDMIKHVSLNSYANIALAFRKVRQSMKGNRDAAAIDAVGSLHGFGHSDGSRKVASAVLRFLNPIRFAVVDYRNWVILSNTEGRYFSDPLLEPLASTIEDSREIPVTTEKYLEYLSVIRVLAQSTNFSAAQIDMALFAFSDEIRPLSYIAQKTKLTEPVASSTSIKYQKMEALILDVINDNKKKGHRRAAETLENYLYQVRRKNPTPDGLMELCSSLARKRPDIDLYLASKGTLTIRQILPELEKIFND